MNRTSLRSGITLDTGALIALERRKQRMVAVMKIAHQDGLHITVPAVVIAEWWRERTDLREEILDSVHVEATDGKLARLVGEALAAAPGASIVDASVMASAAQRGDVVYTSDFEDLDRLRRQFPHVRVLRV